MRHVTFFIPEEDTQLEQQVVVGGVVGGDKVTETESKFHLHFLSLCAAQTFEMHLGESSWRLNNSCLPHGLKAAPPPPQLSYTPLMYLHIELSISECACICILVLFMR